MRVSEEIPRTNWTTWKSLIEENIEMRERLDWLFGEKEQIQYECLMLENRLEGKEQKLQLLQDHIHRSEGKQKEIPLQEVVKVHQAFQWSCSLERRWVNIMKLIAWCFQWVLALLERALAQREVYLHESHSIQAIFKYI